MSTGSASLFSELHLLMVNFRKLLKIIPAIKDLISVVIDTNEKNSLWHRTPKISNSLEELSRHLGKLRQIFPDGTSLEQGQRNLLLPKLYLALKPSVWHWNFLTATMHEQITPFKPHTKPVFQSLKWKVTPTTPYRPWRSINHHHIFHIKTLFWTSMGIEQMV